MSARTLVAFAVLRDGDELRRERTAQFLREAVSATSRRRRAFILFRICRRALRARSNGLSCRRRRRTTLRYLSPSGDLGTVDRTELVRRAHWRSCVDAARTNHRGNWAKLLKQPQVDPHSNFFSLGGHSLLAIQCLSRLREKLPILTFACGFLRERDCRGTGGADPEPVTADNLSSHGRRRRSWSQSCCRRPVAPRSMRPSRPATAHFHVLSVPTSDDLVYGTTDCRSARLQRGRGRTARGELNVDVLERALNAIVARRENLRNHNRGRRR